MTAEAGRKKWWYPSRRTMIYIDGVIIIALLLNQFWIQSEAIWGTRVERLMSMKQVWSQPYGGGSEIHIGRVMQGGLYVVARNSTGVSILETESGATVREFSYEPYVMTLANLDPGIPEICRSIAGTVNDCPEAVDDPVEIIIVHAADKGSLDVIRDGKGTTVASGLGIQAPSALIVLPSFAQPIIILASTDGTILGVTAQGDVLWRRSAPTSGSRLMLATSDLDYQAIAVAASEDGQIAAYSGAGDELWTRQEGPITAMQSMYGKVYLAGKEGGLTIYNSDGTLHRDVKPTPQIKMFSPDYQSLAAGLQGGEFWVISADGGNTVYQNFIPGEITSMAFSQFWMPTGQGNTTVYEIRLAADHSGKVYHLQNLSMAFSSGYDDFELTHTENMLVSKIASYDSPIIAMADEPDYRIDREQRVMAFMTADAVTWNEFSWKQDPWRTAWPAITSALLAIGTWLIVRRIAVKYF